MAKANVTPAEDSTSKDEQRRRKIRRSFVSFRLPVTTHSLAVLVVDSVTMQAKECDDKKADLGTVMTELTGSGCILAAAWSRIRPRYAYIKNKF